MKKPGIPAVPKPGEDRTRFDAAIKEALEVVMGRRGNPLKELDPLTATAAETVAKVNEILGNVQ